MAAANPNGKQAQMLDGRSPFILFEDARQRPSGPALLYRQPVDLIEARHAGGVDEAFERLETARQAGLHTAGYISYEAGHALEPRLRSRCATSEDWPLLWFGTFEDAVRLTKDEVERLLPDGNGAWASTPRPLISQDRYEAAVAEIQERILAGDIYQANLTFQAEVQTAGHPLALYADIRKRAAAGHSALLFTGEDWVLSFSPELFFRIESGRIVTRPMKGTSIRSPDPEEDQELARRLREDPKQRAENLMIVDLLRNDLSRISKAGSVKVPELFTIETYPTVHQMTSTVEASLEPEVSIPQLFKAIFPCGSITGAPKIRAMEIIGEIEVAPRSIYTGSIGWIAPDGSAEFNVAIRTLAMGGNEKRATMGLGSAIVTDSDARGEWRECLSKGAFVASDRQRFDLIETLRFDPEIGVVELERHLARLKNSAAELGFPFNRHSARNDLQAATFRLREPRKIRLRLSASGALSLEGRPMPATPSEPVGVKLAPLPVPSADIRLRHKTSDRSYYDPARIAAGSFEVVFVDEECFLTEGSFTNLFVEKDGKLLTPPSSRGLLPGILREKLLDEGKAEEAELRPADLERRFYVGNDLRGLIRGQLI